VRQSAHFNPWQVTFFLCSDISGVGTSSARAKLVMATSRMKPTHLNALIDAIAFIAFLFLLTTGLLLEYQLPPGSGGLHDRGAGQGASDRSVQLVWGWTRHEWGQIHYWLALTITAVLAFHLLLHWKWIVCMVRGKPTAASGYRLTLGVVGLVFTVLLSAVPLMSATTRVSRRELRESRASQEAQVHESNDRSNVVPQKAAESSTSIRGSMTLREISNAAKVPVAILLKTLDLPPDVNANTGAGRLMRQHGLTMSDLRQAIDASRSAAATLQVTNER
jgi:hypothetical protein